MKVGNWIKGGQTGESVLHISSQQFLLQERSRPEESWGGGTQEKHQHQQNIIESTQSWQSSSEEINHGILRDRSVSTSTELETINSEWNASYCNRIISRYWRTSLSFINSSEKKKRENLCNPVRFEPFVWLVWKVSPLEAPKAVKCWRHRTRR